MKIYVYDSFYCMRFVKSWIALEVGTPKPMRWCYISRICTIVATTYTLMEKETRQWQFIECMYLRQSSRTSRFMHKGCIAVSGTLFLCMLNANSSSLLHTTTMLKINLPSTPS